MVTVNTQQQALWEKPQEVRETRVSRPHGTPGAQSSDTIYKLFVDKLVRGQRAPPPSLSPTLIWKFQEQGQEASSLPGEGGARLTHPVYLETHGPPENTGFLAVSSPVGTPTAPSCGGAGATAGRLANGSDLLVPAPYNGGGLRKASHPAAWEAELLQPLCQGRKPRLGQQPQGPGLEAGVWLESVQRAPIYTASPCPRDRLAIRRAEEDFACPQIAIWGGSCGHTLSPSGHRHQRAHLPGPVLDLGDPGLGNPTPEELKLVGETDVGRERGAVEAWAPET